MPRMTIGLNNGKEVHTFLCDYEDAHNCWERTKRLDWFCTRPEGDDEIKIVPFHAITYIKEYVKK